ncbi:DNA-processing protein DprA [Lysobacter silvisoli]|uniref:DNA-protecting protein DprA n=1 Tax=Lysobacter silvisoli TaxID=2293254 RepID=A0A371K0S2_9GAMM|nr:DNA-processing protein DprA [Lysobacter silvisoli]RDZ27505.1 DNA-protecting protein DprA [Lysobacter silvisoli]
MDPCRDDRLALTLLVAADGASEPRRALLDALGSPARALAAGPGAWREAGLDAAQIAALRAPDAGALARCAAWLDGGPGRHLIGWHSRDYPALLRQAPSPPLALFVAGDPALLWRPALAVVGTRGPTPGGRDNAAEFARAAVAAGLAVTSGLAAGVDTAAHQAALDAGGVTVAVLGTGPDVAYPYANRGLLARIAASGAVVSEHRPGTQARPGHFPARNRIIAGLSLGTLVIEAAQRSGALITARLAAEAGREVMALPGSIHNPLARGCHRLIRDGAALVEAPAEAIAALEPLAQRLAADLRQRLHAPIAGGLTPVTTPVQDEPCGDGDYQSLWNALGHDPTDMDRLAQRTGLTPAVLSSMLLLMELEGRVAAQHGRYFRNR